MKKDRAKPRAARISPGLRNSDSLRVRMMAALRAEGLSYQAIADRLGVPYRHVYVTLNRERVREYNRLSEQRTRSKRSARRRAQKAAAAPKCSTCGQSLAGPVTSFPPVCRKCRREKQAPRLVPVDIINAWNRGESTKTIARRYDLTPHAIICLMSRLRMEGHEIAYRHPSKSEARPRPT